MVQVPFNVMPKVLDDDDRGGPYNNPRNDGMVSIFGTK